MLLGFSATTTCLDAFPNVVAFKKRMETHPDLAAYFERTTKKT